MWEMNMIAAAERQAYRHDALLGDPAEARRARYPAPDDPADAVQAADGRTAPARTRRPLRQGRTAGPRARRLHR